MTEKLKVLSGRWLLRGYKIVRYEESRYAIRKYLNIKTGAVLVEGELKSSGNGGLENRP